MRQTMDVNTNWLGFIMVPKNQFSPFNKTSYITPLLAVISIKALPTFDIATGRARLIEGRAALIANAMVRAPDTADP